MKMYYVRHGQTDWNLARKMQGGQTERNLNETGKEQAEQTRRELADVKYDIIICSPMERAKETARIISQGRNVPMVTDERLRERKLGEMEGNPITEECEKLIWDYNQNIEIKGGESLSEFEKRVLDFLEEAKNKYENDTILVVAHGGVAKVIKAYLYGKPKDNNLNNYQMKNCEIIEAEF